MKLNIRKTSGSNGNRDVSITKFGFWVWPLTLAVIQFIALLAWSVVKWHNYSYTYDFAIYYQAAYLIAHGSWNPFSSVLGFPFMQNDFEIIMWPVGWLLAIIPSPFLLPALQDLALSSTTFITLLWVRDILRDYPQLSRGEQQLLQGVATVFLVLTPWIYWAASFDFHIEPLILPFVVMAGWSFWKNKRLAGYLWTVVFLLGGNVAATYVAGLGLMEILHGRRHYINGVMLFILSGIALVAIEKLVPGGIQGGNLASFYGYLAGKTPHVTAVTVGLGILKHPTKALGVLWRHRLNIIGEVAPAGLIGVLSPIGIGVSSVVLLTDNLISGVKGGHGGLMFGSPQYFQGITTIPFVVVGTIVVLGYLRSYLKQKWQIAWYGIISVLVANTTIWFMIWTPHIPLNLVNIHRGAARILATVEHHNVLPNQQVASTQAFVGRFAGRRWVSTFMSDGATVHVFSNHMLFLISPYQGIEGSSVLEELTRIWRVAMLPGSKLVAHGDGIWAFTWTAPSGTKEVDVGSPISMYPAWALNNSVGVPILKGPVTKWYMTSNGHMGYVVDGFYLRVAPGRYNAVVRLSTTSPVNVEVWNATGNALLARRTIPSTRGVAEIVTIPVNDVHVYPHIHFFRGTDLWKISPPPPSKNNELELRVWTNGQGRTNVYGVNIYKQIK